ncbi:MAG: IS200/IS605 family transposase [Elusimicrobiota bacterium]|jgi:putative transposase|nr:IS200/IS605 family transposase [Elusimicrobiota bacterium]
MTEYLHGVHSVFLIHLHIVWITKYRKKILNGDVALKVREIIRDICKKEDVEILRGHVSADHVHLFVSIRPKTTISKLVQQLKGRTSHTLMTSFDSLKKQYWGRHMWARGYFCCSSGNVTDEVIKNYIENQNIDEEETFKVD